MEPHLCLPIDVVREFNPQVTQDQIQGPFATEGERRASIIGEDDYNQILVQIESTETILGHRYGQHYKRQSVSDKTPNDYFQKSSSMAYPKMWVSLPDTDIVSVERVEVRVGRDSDDWETVPAADYTVDYDDGTMVIQRFRWLSDLYDHPGNSIRLAYTHGTPGNDAMSGGQTTVTANTGTGTGTWDLVDASLLPENPQTFQIDGEYVKGTVDKSADTLEVTTRGWRGTTDEDHASGEAVHYCPLNVRQAVARKVAVWMENSTIKTNEIAGAAVDPQDRISSWKEDWEALTASGGWHSG